MDDTDTDADGPVSRRGFLRAATGAAAVASASGAAAAQESGGSGGGSGGSAETVTVGPGGSLVFDPDELTIAPGTAVTFEWGSGGHNVVPENGNWGHEPLEDSGFSYTTPPFSETGEFGYHCEPHKSAGMVGTIVVQEGGASSGSSEPAIPNGAKTIGIAATSLMLSTLGLAYFFIRYGGDFETGTDE